MTPADFESQARVLCEKYENAVLKLHAQVREARQRKETPPKDYWEYEAELNRQHRRDIVKLMSTALHEAGYGAGLEVLGK